MEIGRRIREARDELGMQRTVLARRVDTHPNYLYELEIGKRMPSLEMLEKIARVLRVEPAELLREPAPLGEAPQGSGQPGTAPPSEQEPTVVPQSADTLKADVDRIKRLKGQHADDLEKIHRRVLDADAVLRMETVDKGVRATLEERGVLGFAEAVKARREFAQREAIGLCHELLRELANLEALTDQARAESAMASSDIHEEAEKGISQAESWVSGEGGRGCRA
jgi:transcriptional regulator with XRE-family HTH domain